MTSIVDLALQNPVTSSGGTPRTLYVPSYGTMQAATAAGFPTPLSPGTCSSSRRDLTLPYS
ncbi:hypothetical protein [Streptomyces sp. NPDC057301]|uniref:hypothetical protein n=1 Tax=Streptomyces sp. NPDC057301 TaxID=3346093 RepID=UPI00363AA42B